MDGDGRITGLDSRILVTLCTRPRCAVEAAPNLSLTFTSPANGSSFNTAQVPINIGFNDPSSVIDLNTLSIQIDGANANSLFSITASGASYISNFTSGQHTVDVSVQDQSGNTVTASTTFTVSIAPLVSRPVAFPASGEAPLTVRFTPEFDTDTAIERFSWDFDGDGGFDRTEVIGSNQTFTYRTPGTYNALLRITDRNGKEANGFVTIEVGNKPPVVAAEASPSNGQIPLLVNFNALATDSDGIALYEWDFEGDGVFDYSSPTSGNTSFNYETAGTFQAVVRVTDTLGASTVQSLPTTEVRSLPPGSPSVNATVSPTSGIAPLQVNFNASASDPDNLLITDWSWDFEDDGAIDFSSATSGSASHTYSVPGTYFARVKVTASDGQMAEDLIQITVNHNETLSISNDTIDPGLGETVSIDTTLTGDTDISLVIEDRGGQQVRELAPWETRTSGSYNDIWDGLDDAGNPVKEGDYYAILLSRIDGVETRLDLRETTGGRRSNPPRTRMPTNFAPFANDPLDITFTLSRASEVTAFMGLYNTNTRLITFFERKSLGKGSHTITWHGENSDGQLIHPPFRDRFLFGIFGFTLADNAIYVRSGAHVSNVSALPSILEPDGHKHSTISFDLSKNAVIELSISNVETGGRLATVFYPDQPQGTNTINWNGKTNAGTFVAPGKYRLGLTAIDEEGYRSITVYTVQRIYY